MVICRNIVFCSPLSFGLREVLKITYTNLFEQKEFIFPKRIKNPKLELKLPKNVIIIGSLKFQFKLVVREAF